MKIVFICRCQLYVLCSPVPEFNCYMFNCHVFIKTTQMIHYHEFFRNIEYYIIIIKIEMNAHTYKITKPDIHQNRTYKWRLMQTSPLGPAMKKSWNRWSSRACGAGACSRDWGPCPRGPSPPSGCSPTSVSREHNLNLCNRFVFQLDPFRSFLGFQWFCYWVWLDSSFQTTSTEMYQCPTYNFKISNSMFLLL